MDKTTLKLSVPNSAYAELMKSEHMKPDVKDILYSATKSGNYMIIRISDKEIAKSIRELLSVMLMELDSIRKVGNHRMLSTFKWMDSELSNWIPVDKLFEDRVFKIRDVYTDRVENAKANGKEVKYEIPSLDVQVGSTVVFEGHKLEVIQIFSPELAEGSDLESGDEITFNTNDITIITANQK